MLCGVNKILFILFSIFTSVAHGDTPEPRAHHGCAILDTTIYCYGGVKSKPVKTAPEQVIINNVFLSLDISRPSGVGELEGAWRPIDGDFGPNFFFAMAPLPETDQLIIDGGRGQNENETSTQEISYIYDVKTKQWNSQIGSSKGHIQTHSHVATTWRNDVFFAGGKMTESTNNTDSVYPSFMTIFETLNLNWDKTADILRGLTENVRLRHDGALASDNRTIYYVGGYYPTTTYLNATYNLVNMSHIQIYDTINAAWGMVEAGGLEPSGRIDHTFTMMPNTGDFILYGGMNGDTKEITHDYCYILHNNSGTLTWIKGDFQPGATGAIAPGPLYGHSAVLVQGTSLFIIFGISSSNGEANSNINVLDINKMEWQSSFSPASGGKNNDGWIAGTVIGTAIGVTIVTFFVLRKLRTRRRMLLQNRSTENGDHNASSAIGIQVDNPQSNRIPHSINATTATENTTVVESVSNDSPYPSVKPDGAPVDSNGNATISTRLVMSPVTPDIGHR